jgi:hypothetical protein
MLDSADEAVKFYSRRCLTRRTVAAVDSAGGRA